MGRVRRTTTIVFATLAVAVSSVLLVGAPSATGQTGYPPGPAPGPQVTAVVQTLPPARPVIRAASTGVVAFTGANILRWSAIALVLVVAGSVVIGLNRRRGDRSAT